MDEDKPQSSPASDSGLAHKKHAETNPPAKQDSDSPLPSLPQDVLDRMPPDVRTAYETFSVQLQSGSSPDPIRAKITSQHITDIINQTGEDHERISHLVKHGRYMGLAILLVVLVFVFCLYVLFRDKPETVQPILTHLIAFAGGIGGGMALQSRTQ